MQKQSKNILHSRILWTNLLGPVFLYVTMKYGVELDETSKTQIILLVMGAANIALRAVTNQAVHLYAPAVKKRRRRKSKSKALTTTGDNQHE